MRPALKRLWCAESKDWQVADIAETAGVVNVWADARSHERGSHALKDEPRHKDEARESAGPVRSGVCSGRCLMTRHDAAFTSPHYRQEGRER
jgi:hypothetical protein